MVFRSACLAWVRGLSICRWYGLVVVVLAVMMMMILLLNYIYACVAEHHDRVCSGQRL